MDWTPVIAAIVAGVAGVFVGLVAAIFGARTAKRQDAAAFERSALELEESLRAERRDLYVRLVVAEREVWARAVEDGPNIPLDEMKSSARALFESVVAVALSGNTVVATAAVKLHIAIRRAISAMGKVQEDESCLPEWTDLVEVQWRAAARELIDAMRSDVAADHLPVAWTATGAPKLRRGLAPAPRRGAARLAAPRTPGQRRPPRFQRSANPFS